MYFMQRGERLAVCDKIYVYTYSMITYVYCGYEPLTSHFRTIRVQEQQSPNSEVNEDNHVILFEAIERVDVMSKVKIC